MIEEPATISASPSEPKRENVGALLRWLTMVAVAFMAIAWGMAMASRTLPLASPGATAPNLAGGPAGVGPAGSPSDLPPSDFRAVRLEGGGPLGPPDFAGKIVVIDFWATWCGPCRLQAQYLDRLHEELDEQDVQFLAISLGEDEATVKRFVDKTPFPYPVLIDPEDQLTQRFGIYSLPTVMVIDRRGQTVFMRPGVTDLNGLRAALAKAGLEA